MKNKILEEINKYSPHTENSVITTLMAIKDKTNVINWGEPGQGKTHDTVELLNYLKIDYELISGHCTAKALFEILQRNKLTVIDESATILRDMEVVNILLSALWGGQVIWKTNREDFIHNFKGNIIFNTNSLTNNEFLKALKDRCIFNKVNLNSEQIKDKIESSLKYKPNKRIWAQIRKNLENDYKLSKKDLNLLYKQIKDYNPKSMRDFWKLKKIARFSKILIGDFSLINCFFEKDPIQDIINSNIKQSEKVKRLAELDDSGINYNSKLRKYQRMVKKNE